VLLSSIRNILKLARIFFQDTRVTRNFTTNSSLVMYNIMHLRCPIYLLKTYADEKVCLLHGDNSSAMVATALQDDATNCKLLRVFSSIYKVIRGERVVHMLRCNSSMCWGGNNSRIRLFID
jgi:hypothetical protein